MSDEIIDEVAAPEVDKPDDDAEATGAPVQAEQSQGEESFTDFDPAQIPENGASPQWLKEQYDLMRGDYTRKMQDFGQTRRDREQLQQIVDGLKAGDAETRRSLLQLLGVDQAAALEAYGLEMAQQEAAEEEQGPQLDEFDPTVVRDPRVDAWEAEKAEQRQQEAVQAEQQEAEAAADEVGGQMEEELTSAFNGELPEDAVQKFIFDHAIENPDQLGKPDVQAGVAAWNKILAQQQEQWLASRGGPRAATQGIPGSERFDTSTKAGREALALEGVRGAGEPR